MVDHTLVDIDVNEDYVLNDDASLWSAEKVKTWLKHNGYKDLAINLSKANPSVTGEILLTLSVDDLQRSPYNIKDLHEREHLHLSIEGLRKVQFAKYMKNIELNGMRNGFHNGNSQSLSDSIHCNGNLYSNKDVDSGNVHQHINAATPLLSGDDEVESSVENRTTIDPYPSEKLKTFFAVLYLLFGFFITVTILQFVHERVPSKTEDPPLPDLFFDLVPKRIEWAFNICETAGIILTTVAILIGVFHRHRSIILRRLCFIMGTLYIYRSCTMFVTTLPVPGMHFLCAPKTHYKISIMFSRAATLFYGGGLSVTGSHHLCGDYLFSGHTIILVLSYLTITEYSSKRWWWLHWVSWLLSAVGIVCILLAHDHYTVDVVVAYLLTTRLFWTYHTMCNTGALKELTNSNLLSRAWWFPLFSYFESNVMSNGSLPCQFEWPLPWPQRFRTATNHRRSLIKGV